MTGKLTDNDAILREAVNLAERQHAAGEPISPTRIDAGEGCYMSLVVKGKPAARWQFDYAFAGKRKTLTLGRFPVVDHAGAMTQRRALRARLAAGADPSQDRRDDVAKQEAAREAAKQAVAVAEAIRDGRVVPGSFEAVAREFADVKGDGQWSPAYKLRWLRTMEIDVFPRIGAMPIRDVTRQMIVAAARGAEERGAKTTAHLIADWTNATFRFAVNAGHADANPAQGISSILKQPEERHMGAAVTPAALRLVMSAVLDYPGTPIVRAALRFSALVFQRPGNVRAAEWSEIDLDGAMWTIPAHKMKRSLRGKATGAPHLVPLSRQAVELLRELKPLTGHMGPYCFPAANSRGRCMSEAAVLVALRRMGFQKSEMTAHGFRAAARTLGEQVCKIPAQVLEAQLAHAKTGPLGAAYDRTDWLEDRRLAMQTWADYLDRLTGDNVQALKRA